MNIHIPHPDCPKCNPKCPCCGTPIRTAPPVPTVNPGPFIPPQYPYEPQPFVLTDAPYVWWQRDSTGCGGGIMPGVHFTAETTFAPFNTTGAAS